MEFDLTIEEVRSKGKNVGSYVTYPIGSQYTIWQLNRRNEIISVVIHDNMNEIVVIYNLSTERMVYMSPHTQLSLKDLRVK